MVPVRCDKRLSYLRQGNRKAICNAIGISQSEPTLGNGAYDHVYIEGERQNAVIHGKYDCHMYG